MAAIDDPTVQPAPAPATPEGAGPPAPEAPAPSPDANGVGNGAGTTLQAQLRAAAARAAHRKTIDLEIPGYDGRLFGTFRALDDYGEIRKIIKRHEKVLDETTQELYVAADTLVASSVTTFAVMDGDKHPLGITLGMPLAAYLGFEGPENDRQAVFSVIPSTMSVMALFAELNEFIKSAGRETADELVGESEAAS